MLEVLLVVIVFGLGVILVALATIGTKISRRLSSPEDRVV